jgi:hypothetical protein
MRLLVLVLRPYSASAALFVFIVAYVQTFEQCAASKRIKRKC